ncbi:protease complex subunit PrcB family protein, partial [bacterium]|nr:protease complex subunit PrcB family protein [bacterium]
QLVWPQIRVIASEAEFSAFWESLHRNLTPLPPLPSVDFTHSDVVAVVDMVRPTGGYGIEVQEVQEGMDGIWLTIIRRKPGERCFTTQALTQPYHLIAIRKSGKRHIPKYFDVTYSCP